MLAWRLPRSLAFVEGLGAFSHWIRQAGFDCLAAAAQLAFAEGLGARSHYQGAAAREGAQPRARLVRVGKEVASLGTDLPLNPSSSVFIRVDEQNMVLWQALITGRTPG